MAEFWCLLFVDGNTLRAAPRRFPARDGRGIPVGDSTLRPTRDVARRGRLTADQRKRRKRRESLKGLAMGVTVMGRIICMEAYVEPTPEVTASRQIAWDAVALEPASLWRCAPQKTAPRDANT